MAFQVKFTVKRDAATNPAAVTIAAGSAEAQSDTISLNMDITNMSKGDAIVMLENLQHSIERGKWPPL